MNKINKFEEALKINRTRELAIKKKQMKQRKINEIKEWVLFGLIAVTIIIMLIMILNNMSNTISDAHQLCINEGHSYNYCMKII